MHWSNWFSVIGIPLILAVVTYGTFFKVQSGGTSTYRSDSVIYNTEKSIIQKQAQIKIIENNYNQAHADIDRMPDSLLLDNADKLADSIRQLDRQIKEYKSRLTDW